MSYDVTAAEFVREITLVDQAPKPPRPAIVFAGRSNVGKSALLNALVRKKALARTSSTPGRTQSIVYFNIDGKYYFVDLPGYGYAKVPKRIKEKWGPMVERFLRNAEGLRLVIVILDIRRDPAPDDLQLVEWLESNEVPYFFAVTKADKVSKTQLPKRIDAIRRRLGLDDDSGLLPFSAKTGLGRKELLKVIGEALS